MAAQGEVPQFVAEVSSNHNKDLPRCLAFIDKAAEIGCAGVKFQLFKVSELFAPEVLMKRSDLRRRLAWELPVEFLPAIAERCRQHKIQFGCTPFYLDAVDELAPYVDFFKIASYELLWGNLLSACARTGKPIVLSTGMANLDEIHAACQILEMAGCVNLTLLHCISGYPAPVSECNLSAIENLTKSFPFRIGWSDHSVNSGVLFRAIHRWGANMVEFHLDLEGAGEEYELGHCWLPDQIGLVIESVRQGFQADGNGEKLPATAELHERLWRADPADGLRPIKSER